MWYKKSLLLIVFTFINFLLTSTNYAADRNFCEAYAKEAQKAVNDNKQYQCGFTGLRWSEGIEGQKQWCLTIRQGIAINETRVRTTKIKECQNLNEIVNTNKSRIDCQLHDGSIEMITLINHHLDCGLSTEILNLKKIKVLNHCVNNKKYTERLNSINKGLYSCLSEKNESIKADFNNDGKKDVFYLSQYISIKSFTLITVYSHNDQYKISYGFIDKNYDGFCKNREESGCTLKSTLYKKSGVRIKIDYFDKYNPDVYDEENIIIVNDDSKWRLAFFSKIEQGYDVNGYTFSKENIYSVFPYQNGYYTEDSYFDPNQDRTGRNNKEYGSIKENFKSISLKSILLMKKQEFKEYTDIIDTDTCLEKDQENYRSCGSFVKGIYPQFRNIIYPF